ncbi:MAG: BNR-4 repeat-containing protein [Acidobacteria bacterium]|nr:BNR-4 repeat-containing protein [Acidobacteriota bacterium]
MFPYRTRLFSPRASLRTPILLFVFLLVHGFSGTAASAQNYGSFSEAATMGAPLPRRSIGVFDPDSNRTFFVYPAGADISCSDLDGQCSPSTSTLRVFNNVSNSWMSGSLAVGDAIAVADAHAYPAITISQDGIVHVFSGGHGTPLVHRHTTMPTTHPSFNPLNASHWTAGSLPVGNIHRATYPLVFLHREGAADEELFLIWRQSSLLLGETCGSTYFDPDGQNCVGKTYDPVYFSRFFRPTPGAAPIWSTPVLLIDPAPFRTVNVNGQNVNRRYLDGWDRIYVNGAKQKGGHVLFSFTNTLQDNRKTDWHYFAVFDFDTRRIYGSVVYNGGSYNPAGGYVTLPQSVFDDPASGFRYYKNTATPQRRGGVALDELPGSDQPQIFQTVTEDLVVCPSCNDEGSSTPRRTVRHFSWNRATNAWGNTRYYNGSSNPDSVEVFDVVYDTLPTGSNLDYRFHLYMGYERACKINFATRTCPDGSSASRCIWSADQGIFRHTKEQPSNGGNPTWTKHYIARFADDLTDFRYKHFALIHGRGGAAPPDMAGTFFLGTIDAYFRSCAWQYPKSDQSLHFWNGN